MMAGFSLVTIGAGRQGSRIFKRDERDKNLSKNLYPVKIPYKIESPNKDSFR